MALLTPPLPQLGVRIGSQWLLGAAVTHKTPLCIDLRSGEAGEWLLEHLHAGVHIKAVCLSSLKNMAKL